MSELSQTLEVVRNKLAQLQGIEVNEQNTKTALIDPVLRALGWEIGNLEEVSQEYRRKPKDNPVDYAMFLLRTAALFVEAKALRKDLNDPKWTGQIMGYAAVCGVKWTVITNGDEWRIYNACVERDVDEKLFRAVRLTDPTPAAESTLALLSKEQMRGRKIDDIWESYDVDRKVRQALEQIFSPEPSTSLVHLIKKYVHGRSPKDIRASLSRVRVRFDFPAAPESSPSSPGEQPEAKRAEPRKQKTPGSKKPGKTVVGVSLRQVIEAGLLKTPLRLFRKYKGQMLEATLQADGKVVFQGAQFPTCSAAAEEARRVVTGQKLSTNGWSFWQYEDGSGKKRELFDARADYLAQNSGTDR